MPSASAPLGTAAADRKAAAEMLPLVYSDLRLLAARRLAAEPSGQTLNATALVHEAYLRLVGRADERRWESRGHFFAAAAQAMRRILVDAARRKRAQKHAGGHEQVELTDLAAPTDAIDERLLALDEALTRFADEAPLAASLVELRHFAGLSIEDAAVTLGLSRAAGYRHWTYARAWLRDAIAGTDQT